MPSLRDNWRIVLLVILLLGSAFALFSPTMGASSGSGAATGNGTSGVAATNNSGVTNLQYSLDLAGGTRIRAPLAGVTAENVNFGNHSQGVIEKNVASQMQGVSVTDVTAQRTGNGSGTVEVTTKNVTTQQLSKALDAAGYKHGNVRDGVTQQTREQTVKVLESKINQAGLKGGSVQSVTTSNGQHFVLIQVPNAERQRVLNLVNKPGRVRVDAYYPAKNGSGYQTRTVLQQGDFAHIGTAERNQQTGMPFVSVVVKDGKAKQFQKDMVQTGVAQQGGTTCHYEEKPNQTDPCLLTKVDGKVVYAAGMTPSLAQSIRSGQWSKDPQFALQTRNYSEAQTLSIDLHAGALPAPLNTSAGTSSYVSPTQGASFRSDAIITGIIAVLAVSAVVFLRYGEMEVAAPMIVTALSELFILMGFASLIGYPIDLSVIAGFVAVIGTGVDDLIIIADEVLSEGKVRSKRVFRSRFRKAFWVIGAAAATTIIAMSPLAFLSLGDLRGFAIFTILGVLVGVLVTRPAYGDILRALITRQS